MAADKNMNEPASNIQPSALDQLIEAIRHAFTSKNLVKLTLGKYLGNEPELQKLHIRPVTIRRQEQLSFVFTYKTRDITKNYPLEDALMLIRQSMETGFRNAHLFTKDQEISLETNKKGEQRLRSMEHEPSQSISTQHNREKKRWIDVERPWLVSLGVTDANHRVIHSMSDKWKQINKFVEVFAHAIKDAHMDTSKAISVVDFGCGKGYLTFAIHDYLYDTLHNNGTVTGVELRTALVDNCNNISRQLDDSGLQFVCGDVRTHAPQHVDVMIALHACDTATDYAMAYGVNADAKIILCSPCCHKEIRPQMQSPSVLKPLLHHGIHLGQEAEMVTDGLRALLLEARGYTTKIFEFISLEHTSKNKMVLAIKTDKPRPREQVIEEISHLKAFYGISNQCLENLLEPDSCTAPSNHRH